MQTRNQPPANPSRRNIFALRRLCIAASAATMLALAAFSLPAITAAQSDFDLRAAVAAAQPGATIHVPAGIYPAPIVIDKPLTLIGEGMPVIQGDGTGDVVEINAPDVTLRGFVVRGSGDLARRRELRASRSAASMSPSRTTGWKTASSASTCTTRPTACCAATRSSARTSPSPAAATDSKSGTAPTRWSKTMPSTIHATPSSGSRPAQPCAAIRWSTIVTAFTSCRPTTISSRTTFCATIRSAST